MDWLIENVHLVEITAYSDDDAYTIFETMNDRGLSLTPADMLKGYLLANITDAEHRTRASRVWKERVQALAELGKDEDADGIKSWLRSQYAESIRERKRGAAAAGLRPDRHRVPPLGAGPRGTASASQTSAEFARFIERDFAFYGGWYERLRRAAETLTPGLECVHFNAQHNFTLQYPVLLAPLRVGGRRGDRAAQDPRRRGVSRHPDPSPHLELAGDRLLDDAVRDVPRDARNPREERRRAGRVCCANGSTPRRRPSPATTAFDSTA